MGGKPWFAHYDAGVPRTLAPYTPKTLLDYVADTAGAIVVPLNPLYSSDELQLLLADCGAETVVILAPFSPRVQAVQPHTAVKWCAFPGSRGGRGGRPPSAPAHDIVLAEAAGDG